MGLNQGRSKGRWRGYWRAWLVPGGLVLVTLMAALAGDEGRQWLRYDRSGIASGELWRLLTGHILHLGLSHLALNLAGLVLVWYLVGEYIGQALWLIVLVVVIAGIDAGLWWLEPQLVWYVGLSGVLHGMLAAGVVGGWPAGGAETRVLALALAAKLAYEQWLGPLPGSETSSGGHVVVAAHFYGALSGLLAAGLIRIRVRARAPI